MVKVKKGKSRLRLKRATEALEEIADLKAEAEQEVRTFGHVVGEQSRDEALFFVDKEPVVKAEIERKNIRDEKKQRRGQVPLRSEAVLVPNKFVRVLPSERIAAKHRIVDGVGAAEKHIVERAVSSGTYANRTKRKRSNAPDSYDIWEVKPEPKHEEYWWRPQVVRKPVKGHEGERRQKEFRQFSSPQKQKGRGPTVSTYTGLKHALLHPPSLRTPLSAPVNRNIDSKLPDAGSSVNPAFDAHQDLLGEAVARSVAEKFNNEVVESKLRVEFDDGEDDNAATADEHMEATNSTQVSTSNESDADKDDTEEDTETKASFHKKNKDVRKTRTQRSRQKRHKVKLIEISKKKKEASFLKDAGNINKYIAEINESAIPTADKVAKQMRSKTLRKIGGRKIPERELDVTRSDELAPDMRRVKVKGSILRDRFISLQRQGMTLPKGKKVTNRR